MNNALAGRLADGLDRLPQFLSGVLFALLFNYGENMFGRRPDQRALGFIAGVPFLVLPVALQRGYMISQLLTPNR